MSKRTISTHVATSARHRIDKNSVEWTHKTHLLRSSVCDGLACAREPSLNLTLLTPRDPRGDARQFGRPNPGDCGRGTGTHAFVTPRAPGRGFGDGEPIGPGGPTRTRVQRMRHRLRVYFRARGAKVTTTQCGGAAALVAGLGLGDVGADGVDFAGTDWVLSQAGIEDPREVPPGNCVQPCGTRLLQSVLVVGRGHEECPDGKGCSSDNKLGVVQFEYGLVTDRVG